MQQFCSNRVCGHAYSIHTPKCQWPGCACEEMQRRALTPRELQVVRGIAQGQSVKEIATSLGIETKTIEAHKFNATRKLGAHNAVQITIAALKQGLITLDECPDPK